MQRLVYFARRPIPSGLRAADPPPRREGEGGVVMRPQACPDCLRRAQLLADLSLQIDRYLRAKPASRLVELLGLNSRELATVVAPEHADATLTRISSMSEERLQEGLVNAQCWGCCRHDTLFPRKLAYGADAPWVLFGRGDPGRLARLASSRAVAVIGATVASEYGRTVAYALAKELGEARLAVVSGFTFGIDACAQRGGLDGGLAVGVLAGGPDTPSQPALRSLWRRLIEHGLAVSELPPGTSRQTWTISASSRVIAALSEMTVVVESKVCRNESLTVSKISAALGRGIGAIPGRIDKDLSAGPNNLLADGASVIRGLEDVLSSMERQQLKEAASPAWS